MQTPSFFKLHDEEEQSAPHWVPYLQTSWLQEASWFALPTNFLV